MTPFIYAETTRTTSSLPHETGERTRRFEMNWKYKILKCDMKLHDK